MQKITLQRFAGGLITAYDPADVPPETATSAPDVEVEKSGRLRGRLADADTFSGELLSAAYAVDDPEEGGHAGSVVAYDDESDAFNYYGPWDGAVATDGPFAASDGHGYGVGPHPTGITLPTDDPEAAPYWLGPYEHRQFGDVADSDLHFLQGAVDFGGATFNIDSATESAGTGSVFEEGYVYFWRASAVFDGFQETALGSDVERLYLADPADSVSLDLSVKAVADLSRRASHFNLYRARAVHDGSGAMPREPDTPYRLVASIPLNNSWTASGGDQTLTYVDEGDAGATFEQNAGIPQTLEQAYVGYRLAQVEGERLFVADAYHPRIEHASRYVFASLPYRYGVFDWSKDYVVLPETPVRLAAFGGRVLALGRRALYRIGPGPSLEGAEEGVGCAAPTACAVGESGVLFADERGVYHYDGRNAVRVSADIDTSPSGEDGWREGSHGSGPWIAYHRRYGVFVLVYEKGAGEYAGFIYAPGGRTGDGRQGRWESFTVSAPVFHGLVDAPDGEVYASVSTNAAGLLASAVVRQLFAGPSRQAWSWTTPVIDLKSEGGVRSKFYRVEVAGSGLSGVTAEVAYGNGETFAEVPLAATDDGTYSGDVPLVSDARPVDGRVRLRLSGDGTAEVSAASLFHRPLLRRGLPTPSELVGVSP